MVGGAPVVDCLAAAGVWPVPRYWIIGMYGT